MEAINKNMVTEISVSYRPRKHALNRPVIKSPSEAAKLMLCGFDKNTIMMQEQFVVMYLNRANHVLGIYKASKGGITGTVVDIRIILSIGLKLLATSMMIAHNHPSGNLQPSVADQELTNKIQQAGMIMDIKLLDHLIVVEYGKSFSFAEEGYL